MLDWMKGNEGPEAADTSKLLEPPETPAPVFAIRAFKSALFGTPGAEEEQEQKDSDTNKPALQPTKSETTNSIPIPVAAEKEDAKPDDSLFNPSGSPTKSILVTPGTISNRRKTVSFGEGVVDNEGKNDNRSSKVVKTPPNPAGNLTAQWMSGSAEGRPRSQLTQTLMDARDNASKNAGSTESSGPQSVARAQPKEDSSAEDITINLEDPRSESGKYWKTEFDNYRTRTNREIKKLIHYRSIAKSYARKKDSEALRLADKLKEEEEKVVDMERQVTRLASTIAGGNPKANKEDLIQDLTKQTTLALQYKQQVSSLRKSLEQQGVVESKDTKVNEPSKETPSTDNSEELRKAQQELKQAHSEIEELKRQHSQPENSDLKQLRSLAQSSEKKAQELEKENLSLKQTMARVKQEMSRYEGRRKEKETKFRQREIKLEARIQEYRERLKKVTQERRESEDALRANFEEERRRMQSQIDMLKLRASNAERIPALRSQHHTLSPRKEHAGIQVYDFAESDHPEIEEFTEELEAPPSPSPRTKTRHTRNATTGAFDLKRPSQRITTDDEEVTHYLHEILDRPRPKSYQFDIGLNPPSSPPDTAPLKSLDRNLKTRSHQPPSDKQKQKSYRSLYLNDPENTNTRLGQPQRSRPHIRSTLDNISGLPNSRTGTYAGNTISGGERTTRRTGLSGIGGDHISPERVAAAQSRLQQKKDIRKLRAMGEGNLRPMVTSGVDES